MIITIIMAIITADMEVARNPKFVLRDLERRAVGGDSEHDIFC